MSWPGEPVVSALRVRSPTRRDPEQALRPSPTATEFTAFQDSTGGGADNPHIVFRPLQDRPDSRGHACDH